MDYKAVSKEIRASGLSALRSSLRRNGVKYIDLNLFKRIIQNHYFEMPSVLIECLYLAFVQDVQMRISTDNFVETLDEVFSDNERDVRKFVFRVYDVKSNQSVERINVERILEAAYGSCRDRGKGKVEYVYQGDKTNSRDVAHGNAQDQESRDLLDALFTSETKVATVRTGAARGDPNYDGLVSDASQRNRDHRNSPSDTDPGVVTASQPSRTKGSPMYVW